jgi:hypothetical protein
MNTCGDGLHRGAFKLIVPYANHPCDHDVEPLFAPAYALLVTCKRDDSTFVSNIADFTSEGVSCTGMGPTWHHPVSAYHSSTSFAIELSSQVIRISLPHPY